MKIVLVGFIGVGKTEIGKALALLLGAPFFDVDGELETSHGVSVSEIIAKQGLENFRDTESEALDRIMGQVEDCVVATGGGTLARPANRSKIKQNGLPVWLQAKPETVWARVQNKPYVAPLFYTKQDPLAAIRAEMVRRERYYQEVAKITIAVDGKPPDLVGEEIKRAINFKD